MDTERSGVIAAVLIVLVLLILLVAGVVKILNGGLVEGAYAIAAGFVVAVFLIKTLV